MKYLSTLLVVLLCKAAIVCVKAQTHVTYPFPSSIYTPSVNYSLKANGTTVPISSFVGEYDYAHFSLSGAVTVDVSCLTASTISSRDISPKTLNRNTLTIKSGAPPG